MAVRLLRGGGGGAALPRGRRAALRGVRPPRARRQRAVEEARARAALRGVRRAPGRRAGLPSPGRRPGVPLRRLLRRRRLGGGARAGRGLLGLPLGGRARRVMGARPPPRGRRRRRSRQGRRRRRHRRRRPLPLGARLLRARGGGRPGPARPLRAVRPAAGSRPRRRRGAPAQGAGAVRPARRDGATRDGHSPRAPALGSEPAHASPHLCGIRWTLAAGQDVAPRGDADSSSSARRGPGGASAVHVPAHDGVRQLRRPHWRCRQGG